MKDVSASKFGVRQDGLQYGLSSIWPAEILLDVCSRGDGKSREGKSATKTNDARKKQWESQSPST